MAVTGNDMADFRIHERGRVIPTTKEKKSAEEGFHEILCRWLLAKFSPQKEK